MYLLKLTFVPIDKYTKGTTAGIRTLCIYIVIYIFRTKFEKK